MLILYGGKVQALGTLRELLATPDTIRITTPPLPRETMQRVLELIHRDVAEDRVRIDTPTQNLESYFLDVVQRARQSAETSGAFCPGFRIPDPGSWIPDSGFRIRASAT